MRRLLALTLPLVSIWIAIMPGASAEAPLCTLSPDFERQVLSSDVIIGAAVYDLQTGTIWTGGHSGPYALHSAIKPPIAWAVLSDSYEAGRPLTRLHRDALFYMVAWSQNPDVTTLLSMIGGLSGLNDFYERWGVPELIELAHPTRWGVSRARPVHLARLFTALATSKTIPDNARSDGFDLLRAVVDAHRWGAMIPEQSLPGWESLIKTGNFTLPESDDADPLTKIDPRDYDDEEKLRRDLREAENEVGDTPLKQRAGEDRAIVRMNSVAIWLSAPWQGGQPRYVVAIMQESFLSWPGSRNFQNQIGAILANAIVAREAGLSPNPPSHCIKRALS
ncbi:MAG: hypothetical protein OXS30_01190 [Chloroflexota bacterium]|nr:hypothetical protein [Chloroflexota bacterium]